MKRILLVEDDMLLSSILAKNMRNALYEVDCVYTGSEASRILKEETYDLIVLDILLPEKDGFAVLAEIRSVETTKEVPVLVVSNLADGETITKMKQAGANRYIVKAMTTPDALVREIGEMLGRSEA